MTQLFKRGQVVRFGDFPENFVETQPALIESTDDEATKAEQLYDLGHYYGKVNVVKSLEFLNQSLEIAQRLNLVSLETDIRRLQLSIYCEQTQNESVEFLESTNLATELLDQVNLIATLIDEKEEFISIDDLTLMAYTLARRIFLLVSSSPFLSDNIGESTHLMISILNKIRTNIVEMIKQKNEISTETIQKRLRDTDTIIRLINRVITARTEFYSL